MAEEPRRLDDLARRLAGYESCLAALSEVPLPGVQVLGALQVAEALSPQSGIDFDTLVGLLDGTKDDAVREVIAGVLEPRALAWIGGAGDVYLSERLRGAGLDHLGLGRPMAWLLPGLKTPDLNRIAVAVGAGGGSRKQDFVDRLSRWFADAGNVRTLLREAPEDTREILDDVAWYGPEYSYPVNLVFRDRRRDESDQSGLGWAMDRGLLIPVPEAFGVAEMPLEVGLVVRDGGVHLPFTPAPPALSSAPVDPELVAAESASAALRTLDRVSSIVDGSTTEPVPLLKSGAVGMRAINTLAKSLGAAAAEIRLAVDLANALGLLTPRVDEPDDVAPSGRGRSRTSRKHQEEPKIIGLVPSGEYPAWRDMSAAARLCSLITTWLDLPAAPLADQKRLKEVLGGELSNAFVHVRRVVLAQTAELPGGLADPAQLPDTVRWHAPRLVDELVEPSTEATVREATLLGVLASGALTALGSALLDDGASPSSGESAGLAKAAEALVTAARTTALFGADLTAVVTGSADTELAGLLDRAADRESQSSAMTWRFSPASVRRAFDHGASVEGLVGDLSSASSIGELPQPLTYLINDVARRHGEASVIAAASVVVTATESLAAELAAHRKLARLPLHRVAPTTLVAASDPAATLSALRAAGYSPVETAPDGTPALAVTATSPPSMPSTPSQAVAPERRATDETRDGRLPDPAQHAARLLDEPDAPDRDDEARRDRLGAHLRDRMPARMSREWMQLTTSLDYQSTAEIAYREDDGTTTPMRISAVDWYGDTVEVWRWDTHEYRDLEISRVQPPA